MKANLHVEDLISALQRRFGPATQPGKARILTFGSRMTCSVSFSKLLNGHKFFYAVPGALVDPGVSFPATQHGEFILLICGHPDTTLVLPRELMIEMLRNVPTRRVDVFLQEGSYILQTTRHPKLDVTPYLNAFPAVEAPPVAGQESEESARPDRTHSKIQWGLIWLGRTEGCSVWVPAGDRNLGYRGHRFGESTLQKLPNFGFDEITRRIVQNIDVLWVHRTLIAKAFEIESTTSVYSGLLRLNDLVLAQPNVQIDIYLTASRSKKSRVEQQLLRPSFQNLAPKVQFLSFESVEEQMDRLEKLDLHQGARVSGLLRGERFQTPENAAYPDGL